MCAIWISERRDRERGGDGKGVIGGGKLSEWVLEMVFSRQREGGEWGCIEVLKVRKRRSHRYSRK